MKTLKVLTMALVLAAAAAGVARAADLDMAACAPADAKAFIETVDAAGLRQMLMESKFWAALQDTQAFKDWQAGDKCARMQQRIDDFLAGLEMTEGQALKTYLGGRSAVVLLPAAEGKKPDGVLLLEIPDEATVQRLADAVGAVTSGTYRDKTIWSVQKENRTDRMALAGGVLVITGAGGNALEHVLDTILGGASLGADIAAATSELPAGWRTLAYAAQVPPSKAPGVLAMYPEASGHIHFEWRIAGGEPFFALNQPAVLTSPAVIPDTAVAAVATVFYPKAAWDLASAKAQETGNEEKLKRGEMFIRGWFPGHTMDSITNAFGPEAGVAILKGDDGGAPSLLGLVKITANGKPAAQAFKDGLASKAMILSALTEKKEGAPRLNVREETTDGGVALLIVEAPGFLEKVLGDWAKDIALTVAVTDNWLMVGTSVSGVKAALANAAGNGASLAAAVAKDGEKVPTDEAVTRWGVIEPASGADIVLGWAERLAGKERVDRARKLMNLAELMKLVKRFSWQRTDSADAVRGRADVQAIE
jgi:hypothetical protein